MYSRHSPLTRSSASDAEIETMEVSQNDTAAQILLSIVSRLSLPGDSKSYVLWEISKSGLQQLQGWCRGKHTESQKK